MRRYDSINMKTFEFILNYISWSLVLYFETVVKLIDFFIGLYLIFPIAIYYLFVYWHLGQIILRILRSNSISALSK